VIEELGGLDVPLGEPSGEASAGQAWDLVDRVQPEVLVLDPASAPALFGVVPPARRAWWRGLVWLRRAEPERVVRVPEAAGFMGWQRSWLAIPEATSFAAHSCAAGRFHAEAGVAAEVVDAASGASLPPGETGLLALTPLGLEVPLLRYASGVRARVLPGRCACGADGLAMEVL
jgi:hypothetical protein